jgi:hypothetical protein
MQTTRRITFEVSEEQYQKLKDHLEYGLMKKLFGALVEDVVVMLDDFGQLFIVAVLTKRLSYRAIMKE